MLGNIGAIFLDLECVNMMSGALKTRDSVDPGMVLCSSSEVLFNLPSRSLFRGMFKSMNEEIRELRAPFPASASSATGTIQKASQKC